MKNRFPAGRNAVIAFFFSFATLGCSSVVLAQTPLGQPSLDEAKVQIWCATVRYVYEDTGRPQLKNSLRCEAGNLAALAASIRPDSQRVYSLLYQPIEGRGTIYQGKKDNAARLTALTTAIIGKLRASPARRRDPARLARLEQLATALTNYVQNGTPPGELAAAPEQASVADTAVAAAAPGSVEAVEAEAVATETSAATRSGQAPTDAAGSLMNRIFAPLALTLSLLSLVLFGLLRANVSRLLRRQQREVGAAQQAAQLAQTAAENATRATAEAAASAVAATATASQIAAGASAAARAASELPLSLSKLTAGQRAEVEELIRQRVAAEVARLQPATGAGPAADPAPAAHQVPAAPVAPPA